MTTKVTKAEDPYQTITLQEAIDLMNDHLHRAVRARKLDTIRDHLYAVKNILVAVDEAVSGDTAHLTYVEIDSDDAEVR